jgi:hypothetical protein
VYISSSSYGDINVFDKSDDSFVSVGSCVPGLSGSGFASVFEELSWNLISLHRPRSRIRALVAEYLFGNRGSLDVLARMNTIMWSDLDSIIVLIAVLEVLNDTGNSK